MSEPALLKDRYRKVRRQVGLLDFSGRGKVLVSGPDSLSFLHSMISNDVLELGEGRGRYAAFLTPRGRMVADFFVYKFSDRLLLDVSEGLGGELAEALEKFVIMDDVQIHNAGDEWGHWSLQGPESRALLEEIPGISVPELEYLQLTEIRFQSESGWLVKKNDLEQEGFEVLLPSRSATALGEILRKDARVTEVDDPLYEVLRLEAGIPRFGVDMGKDSYPMEARLYPALSLTKGCYVGQEVVAKATHVGGVSRFLSRLQFEENSEPHPMAAVLEESGKKIGHVTSVAFSPRLGTWIGFGYLKRAFSRTGQVLELEGDTGGGRLTVVRDFGLNLPERQGGPPL